MKMRSSVVLGVIVAAAAWSGVASAQAAAVDSTPYIQARDMVSNGEVEKGHRLVDSLLKAAAPGSPAYAEGLYWRAAISQSARDAERDYRQVVVDYPLSPRVPDALLRLGQLEAARGDRDAALQHFQRIVLEYPDSPRRAEASYWVANTYLSHNDLQRGCTANADALARVASTNVELKNRIDYQQLRCRNVQLAKGAVPAVPAAAPVQSAPAPAAASAPARTTSNTREVPVTESRSAADTPVVAAKPESTATAPAVAPEAAPAVAPAAARSDDSASAPAESVATKTTTRTTSAAHTRVVKTSKAADAVKATSAAESRTITSTPRSATAATSNSRGFAVQVAAYKSRVQADSLAARLRARGYASHVDGDTTPYRVRIGHYHTRADAVAELKRLKAKKIDGFVTEP
jgi:cell division protein FtsN